MAEFLPVMIADPYWLVLDHDELPDEDAKF